MKTSALGLSILTLLSTAYGQEPSPREQFQAAVAAYQKSASEETAQKLAELVKKLDPPPAIPEKAEYHALRGAAFAESAKEPAEFQRAVAEFEKAFQIAPWVGEYHYNTALMLKSKGGIVDLEEALRSINLARLFARDEKEKRDATALSVKLEVALEVTKERVSKEAIIAAAKKAETTVQAQAKRFEGKWRRTLLGGDGSRRVQVTEITHGSDGSWSFLAYDPASPSSKSPFVGIRDVKLVGSELRFTKDDLYFNIEGEVQATHDVVVTVSADGNKMWQAYTLRPFAPNRPLKYTQERFFGSFTAEYTK